MSYHVPVLLKECIEGLAIKADGIYVDVTFGGGGHASEILKHLTTGHLYAFDQDADAVKNAERFQGMPFTFIEANFRYIKRYLKMHGVSKVDGILADFGISSHQINEATRGFSTRFDSMLDMRMDQSLKKNAMDVLNTYSEAELHKIFGMYGEVKNAKTLAGHVISARINKKIETVEDFKKILKPLAPRNAENKYYAQVFQAIRIDVNEEIKVIQEFLPQASELLEKDGRLVVIS
ncbi:MAG TPA: 16S rRNA (cytosine(1402)-N(4))-methyltransferase RsmH, partial [Cytophagaceae bacterium]